MTLDRAWGLRLIIIAPLFMQLIFAFGAAKFENLHALTTSFPFQIQNARLFCLAIAAMTLIAIPFMNRYGIKDVGKLNEQGIKPELVLLFLDMVLLLIPTTCVLLLSFIGLPTSDVYFYSYSSFLVMVVWLMLKRKAYLPDDSNNIALITPPSQTVVKSYTYILCGLTALAALFFILKLILTINPPPEYNESLFVHLPWAIIYALIFIGCSMTVLLRIRNSVHAFGITWLTSTLVAYWIPIGTAVYFYWRFKIKPRELPKEIKM